ncbi:MAG TPA: YMGG-like glycine zipper-containing protein [Stellaceae bacterium]|nr:YMGG-like glycine zipper-containing protein [Stellaceae bacterium]
MSKRFPLPAGAAALSLLLLSACSYPGFNLNPSDPGERALTGAAVGAGSGAVLGGVIGGWDGAAVGAAVGGVVGAVTGAATTPGPAPAPAPYAYEAPVPVR